MQVAIDLDKQLQEYLTAYFLKQGQPEEKIAPEPNMSMTAERPTLGAAQQSFANKGVPMEVVGNQPATDAWNASFGGSATDLDQNLPF